MWGRLFGFADTKTNAQSGRPEAPISWGADEFTTWCGWLSSAVILTGAALALGNQELNEATYLAAAAVLLAVINYWRYIALRRKRAKFAAETIAYEKAIATAFD